MQIKDVVVLPMHPVVKETKRKQKKTHMMYNMFTEFHNMDALLCSRGSGMLPPNHIQPFQMVWHVWLAQMNLEGSTDSEVIHHLNGKDGCFKNGSSLF